MLTHFVSLHPLFSSIWKPSSRVNKTYSAKVKTFFVNFSKIEGPNYSFCLFGSDVYIHDVFIHIYKHLIQKEICSSNFPIVSTLLWEIVILYFDNFRNKNYSKKLVLWCCICSCQRSWRSWCCKISGSFQGQSPYGFYCQGCENIWDWQFLRSWYG